MPSSSKFIVLKEYIPSGNPELNHFEIKEFPMKLIFFYKKLLLPL